MWALLIPAAYLLGTLPSAVWIGRAKGVDIRSVGSGNPGASNVTRALGWRWGIAVMALDMAKGALAAAAGLIISGRPAGYVLAGAAVLGHVFPIWTRLRGGKGVATGGGAFVALSPLVAAVLLTTWFVVSKLSGKASLASMLITGLLPIGVGLVRREWWEVGATIAICVLVMARHLGNIRRLLTNAERAI